MFFLLWAFRADKLYDMSWIYLLLAGICEIGFAGSLKLMDGYRHFFWTVTCIICFVCSFAFLQLSVRDIPIGTAYAVWTGIGGAGAAIIGIYYFNDPVNTWRIIFLCLLVTSIIGLKLSSH